MRNTFYFILILSFLSCGKKQNTTESNELKKSLIEFDSSTLESKNTNQKILTFEEINEILYNSFIDGNYGPFVSMNDSGYYYLDLDSYFDRLESLNIFSTEFYKHEENRVKNCKEDLEKMKHSGDTDLGWEPESCSFFNYMYWLKSQESPLGGYEIKEHTIIENSATAKIDFFDNFNGKKSYWGEGYLIKYRKENGAWKVTELVDLE